VLNNHDYKLKGFDVIDNSCYIFIIKHSFICSLWGHAVAQLVEARHYKQEGHGFDSRWGHWEF
jgi:hypothetical protein